MRVTNTELLTFMTDGFEQVNERLDAVVERQYGTETTVALHDVMYQEWREEGKGNPAPTGKDNEKPPKEGRLSVREILLLMAGMGILASAGTVGAQELFKWISSLIGG